MLLLQKVGKKMPAIATAAAAVQRVNVYVLSYIEVYFDLPNIQIRPPSTVIRLTSFTLWIEIAFRVAKCYHEI